MQAFEYLRPERLADAVALLAERPGTARALAGGTDLLVQMRAERFHLDRVVDIKTVPELNELRFDPDHGLTLGAAVPCYRIYGDPAIVGAYPALAESVSIIGGTAIQGRATVGGNLCNASPSGDSIPSLIVYGATCQVSSGGGTRSLPVEGFCVAPGVTVLAPGELLVSVQLPLPQPRSGAHYLRFIPRNEMDIAVAGAAAWVALDEHGVIRGARVALAAVAPVPLAAPAAGDAVIGTTGDETALEAAAAASRAAVSPITDMRGTAAQRRHLAGVLTKRALRGALQRARGEGDGGNQHN